MQENNFFLTNRHLQDLNPLTAGTHDCDPGYGISPAIRRHTLIHYVFRGKGTLYARNEAYPVQAGQAFGAQWFCAGAITKKGHPHHPLYLRKDEKLKPFDVAAYLKGRE